MDRLFCFSKSYALLGNGLGSSLDDLLNGGLNGVGVHDLLSDALHNGGVLSGLFSLVVVASDEAEHTGNGHSK